jgi:hypothetical protein
VTVGNDAYIFCLDDPKNIIEIASLRQIDQLMNPEHFINTGFKLETTRKVEKLDGGIEKKQLIANERSNLAFLVTEVWEYH